MLILMKIFKGSIIDTLLVFLLVFSSVRGNGDDAVHLLEIKPPLVLIVGLSITKEIIEPDCKASSYPGMAHGPVNSPVKGCIRLVPGADLDTRTAP
jgi:hypothetical protein